MDVVIQSLRRCLADGVNSTAVKKFGVEYSYGQVLWGASTLGSTVAKSIRPTVGSNYGPRVACLADPGPAFVSSMWCTWMSGAIFVPLATSHPSKLLESTVANAGASVLLVEKKYVEKVGSIMKSSAVTTHILDDVLHSGTYISDISGIDQDELKYHENRQGDGCLILYTSGTTGQPKGVLHTHKSLMAQVKALVSAWQWESDDRILHTLPLHHIHGLVNGLLCAHYAGATVQFAPFAAQNVWRSFTRNEASVYMGVPTMYAHLLRLNDDMPAEKQQLCRQAASQLRLAVCGSSACPATVMEAWQRLSGQALLERYGMTEIGMALSNPYRGLRVMGTVGCPLPGVDVRISRVDDDHESSVYAHKRDGAVQCDDSDIDQEWSASGDTAGESGCEEAREQSSASGEIRVKGDCVFQEYWQRPDATEAAFDADGYFCTGDTGDTVAVGDSVYYRILGRTSVDIIKSGGFKISALSIENVLLEHEQIKSVAVLGVPDEMYGEKVVCVCELEAPGSLPFSDFITWASARLPVYEIPRDMAIVESMPRNAMGKVNKVQLRTLFFPEQGTGQS